jgi:hypothetical protein
LGFCLFFVGIQEVKQDTLKDKKPALKTPALKPLAAGENCSYLLLKEIPHENFSD